MVFVAPILVHGAIVTSKESLKQLLQALSFLTGYKRGGFEEMSHTI